MKNIHNFGNEFWLCSCVRSWWRFRQIFSPSFPKFWKRGRWLADLSRVWSYACEWRRRRSIVVGRRRPIDVTVSEQRWRSSEIAATTHFQLPADCSRFLHTTTFPLPLEFTVTRSLLQLFRTSLANIVQDCQKFFRLLPVSNLIDIRTARFFRRVYYKWKPCLYIICS